MGGQNLKNNITGSNTRDWVDKFPASGGHTACQDVPFPKMLGTKNESKPRIRSFCGYVEVVHGRELFKVNNPLTIGQSPSQ
jgi:hypothetical protein